MNQLNERLGQFIAAREIDRLTDPDARVARSLAALFHPVLYPGVGDLLRITQQELGYLVGLSRQRVNEALHALQARGLIRIEYGGLRVLDLGGAAAVRARVADTDRAGAAPVDSGVDRRPTATCPAGTWAAAFSMWPVWSSKKKSGSNSRRNSPLRQAAEEHRLVDLDVPVHQRADRALVGRRAARGDERGADAHVARRRRAAAGAAPRAAA